MQGMMQYMYERRHRGMHDGKGTFTRAQAEYKRDSLGRISQSCLKGVMRFGGISALYFGAELAAGIYRARRDYYNATCGGLAAGASAGASCALILFFLACSLVVLTSFHECICAHQSILTCMDGPWTSIRCFACSSQTAPEAILGYSRCKVYMLCLCSGPGW